MNLPFLKLVPYVLQSEYTLLILAHSYSKLYILIIILKSLKCIKKKYLIWRSTTNYFQNLVVLVRQSNVQSWKNNLHISV